MDFGNFIKRSIKIASTRRAQSQMAEFLKTDYHTSLFDSLHSAIKQVADNLKKGGIYYDVKLHTDPDPNDGDDWERMIYVSGQKVYSKIYYYVKYHSVKEDDGDDPDNGQYEFIPEHIFTATRTSCLKEDSETIVDDLKLTVDDDLNPLWNGHSNETVATVIFGWFLEVLEEHYGV
jgi:hypothetical protein